MRTVLDECPWQRHHWVKIINYPLEVVGVDVSSNDLRRMTQGLDRVLAHYISQEIQPHRNVDLRLVHAVMVSRPGDVSLGRYLGILATFAH